MNSHGSPAVVRAWTWLAVLAVLAACGPAPTSAPTAAPPPTEAATATASPVPTSTATPAPTPIPGVQVYPLSSLRASIPWLPLDKARRPFSAYYGFNFQKPPFDNLLIRQAFAAALDKVQIAKEAVQFDLREAVPATTLTPPAVLGRDLYGQVGIPFDPAKAAELLKQAGYASPDNFPHVTLVVYMRSSAAPGVHFRIAKTAVGMWKNNLGIAVELVAVENPAALITRMQGNPADMYFFGWGADYIDPDNYLKVLLSSKSEWNYGHFSSTEYDDLVNRAVGIADPEQRQLLYIQAERVLTETSTAIIPLFHSLSYVP